MANIFGLAGNGCGNFDGDLSTVSTEADRVSRVTGGPVPYLLHLEFQASRDDSLAARTLRYNVLLDVEYRLPVKSVVVLLRPDAESPTLTGTVERIDPTGNGTPYLRFGYDIVRLWQIAPEKFLAGGLATLPLAPLAQVSNRAVPTLIRQMQARVINEAVAPGETRTFWASTFLLMGLRYTPDQITDYLKDVQQLKESSTYQAVLAEGRAEGREEGVRATILRLGNKRFGPPSESVTATLNALHSLPQLEALSDRLLEVESWDELLGE